MNGSTERVISAHAERQAAVWGTNPQGWAELSEAHNEPLFAAVLGAAQVGGGTRLLDVGCGTGRLLALAAEHGAEVTGIDITQPLLDYAATRNPDAHLVRAELDFLPFDSTAFDVVTGVNAFQFALDPLIAFREAARVLVPGGRLVASLFAEPERSESTVIHYALSALLPPLAQGGHAPYALSEPGNLEAAIESSGLELVDRGEVECIWSYSSPDEAARGLLSSAGGAQAAAVAGREAAAEAVRTAVAPYRQPDGTVRMRNTFRWTSATKPS